MAIMTIGLDTSKSWFQVHGVDERAGRRYFVESSLAGRFSRSLQAWSRVSSALKLVAEPIFGPASSPNWDMTFG
jgi:transposase